MPQLSPVDLIRILGQVTLILVGSLVGGTVLGLVLDARLGTSPLLVFGGLAVGSLAAATGVWLYIRTHTRDAEKEADQRVDGR